MKIRDVMTTDMVSVAPDTTYAEAAKLMHEYMHPSVPVCDANGALVGILSEKDLFKAIYPKYADFYQSPEKFVDEEKLEDKINGVKNKPIEKYMTKEVITIDSHEAIMKAGSLMLTCHFHSLPVVDNGKFVGMISREDVFSAILKSNLGF